jgi:hypothetical protein
VALRRAHPERENLIDTLVAMGGTLPRGDAPRFSLRVCGEPRPLPFETYHQSVDIAREGVVFEPCMAMNDDAALVVALLAGAGIGELPPDREPPESSCRRSACLVEC